MNTAHITKAILIAAALALTACSNNTDAPKDASASKSPSVQASAAPEADPTPTEVESNPTPAETTDTAQAAVAKAFFADEEALIKAQAQLQEFPNLKGQDLQVFQSPHFYNDGRIIISLQDPKNPENVDEYTYQGGSWQEPAPVRLEGDGDMKDNVTPLKDMSFKTIAKMRSTWLEKAQGVEGAADKQMSHIYVNINPVTAKRRWFCDEIEGTRAGYTLMFNLDGSVETYEKK